MRVKSKCLTVAQWTKKANLVTQKGTDESTESFKEKNQLVQAIAMKLNA